MSGLFSSLIHGENLNEFRKFNIDGDPRHLGNIGWNLTILALNEQGKATVEREVRERELEREAEAIEAQARSDENYRIELIRDRAEAMRRTARKKSGTVNYQEPAIDSDESVDKFLKGIV